MSSILYIEFRTDETVAEKDAEIFCFLASLISVLKRSVSVEKRVVFTLFWTWRMVVMKVEREGVDGRRSA